ncbi:hypothetical protein ABB37_05739 [Leptomonas pyrrhocoris]|uniref:SET domain-containing protein n=1 Tax=Leptomonas pyrrhocoris TaxID=157538 RepID=A0A0N0DUR2_LEPPY|nr:hypothetical protein ABB37_05739 [Leptomonas pyrrhocoris]KPA79264.1 hypothetical protein ABB37_05739 [Leptomonas pyrrhocoris]|eukprot:XP_015657703.1 hypothetical protein ABB37_05739 [Leptomonas pyrrhocoris]
MLRAERATSPERDNGKEFSLWELVHNTGSEASAAPPQAGRAYVNEVDATGAAHIVYFCGPTCEARSLNEDGTRFVLEPPGIRTALPTNALPEASESHAAAPPLSERELAALRYPDYDTILRAAHHPTSATIRHAAWPTRLSVLSTVHSIARRCNERVWLLVRLMAKELHNTLSVLSSSSSRLPFPAVAQPQRTAPPEVTQWLEMVAVTFRVRLEALCERYAEGAMQLLSADQKALLRFSWQLLTWWWVLCCVEVVVVEENRMDESSERQRSSCVTSSTDAESTSQLTPLDSLLRCIAAGATPASAEEWLRGVLRVAETRAFPLQLYLQLYWLTNANVHMYVVSSPLYALWCRWLADVTPSSTRSEAADSSRDDDQTAGAVQAAKMELFARLYSLFHGTKVWSATTSKSSRRTAVSSAQLPIVADALHATGVALYDRATKLNHSCEPNVCFQPNAGPVEAARVALRHIDAGEEILTSYTRPEQFEDAALDEEGKGGEAARRAAGKRRRRYLQEHYGFVCRCPLCAAAADDGESGDG